MTDARRQRKAAMAREARSEQERRTTQARLSIARELHDVLAHSLSMINVQSSVALELLDEHPERAGPRAGRHQRCQQASDFGCSFIGDGVAR